MQVPIATCSWPAEGACEAVPIHLAAVSTERIHAILRAMCDADWAQFRDLLRQTVVPSFEESELVLLDRLFRKREAIGAQAGGVALRVVQAITSSPALAAGLRQAQERMRTHARFVLREMSEGDWEKFKACLANHLELPARGDDLGVLELVFRIGESITNVETAAEALAQKVSGRKLIDPEIARRNAISRGMSRGAIKIDPDAAYRAAKEAQEEAAEVARRAENTIAWRYVKPATSYRHARSTVFKAVDAILDSPEVMAEAARIEERLLAAGPVSREELRWALHRMPLKDRIEVLKLIPLNTVLMFQTGAGSERQALEFKATRDRRLAYDLFVRSQSEEELMAQYDLSLNALKNAVGAILEELRQRPLARRRIREYLDRTGQIEPMGVDEVRQRLKRLPAEDRAEIVNGVPNCAWKSKDLIPLHKHLFLDYLSGEWVLGALVHFYNLEKDQRLTGIFKRSGSLTLRGANSILTSMLLKIAAEPELRQRLRHGAKNEATMQPFRTAEAVEEAEPGIEELLPGERPGRLTSVAG